MLEVRAVVPETTTGAARVLHWERAETFALDRDSLAVEIIEATRSYDYFGRPAIGLRLAQVDVGGALDSVHDKRVAFVFGGRVLSVAHLDPSVTLSGWMTIAGLSPRAVDEVLRVLQDAL